jgi:hypothetical protein
MDLARFKTSLATASPPADLSPPLVALWWAAKGDWQAAHEVAQQNDDASSAWVHAHLHRIEGDLSNAGYWYRRAGKPAATEKRESEWAAIAAALLASAD